MLLDEVVLTSEEAQTKPSLTELSDAIPHDDDSLSDKMKKQALLMRFDCTISMRAAIWGCVRDLNARNDESELVRILEAKGGMYESDITDCHISPTPIISDVRFTGFALDMKLGVVFRMNAYMPPGICRSSVSAIRQPSWRHGTRLKPGGAVALFTYANHSKPDVRMANITADVWDAPREDGSSAGGTTINFSIVFSNPLDSNWAIDQIKYPNLASPPIRFLVENPVPDNSFMPYLRALESSDSANTATPLARTIQFVSFNPVTSLPPPAYSLKPGFERDLSTLLRTNADDWELQLVPSDPADFEDVSRRLRRGSNLDLHQADAMVSALTNQLALIEETDGVSRTFFAIQLLRILIANKIGPIIVLAQGEGVLDHILTSMHASGVTEGILRLSGHTKDTSLERMSLGPRRAKARAREQPNAAEKQMYRYEAVMKSLSTLISPSDASRAARIDETLGLNFGLHRYKLNEPPIHVQALFEISAFDSGGSGEETATLWKFWVGGMDLKHLAKLAKKKTKPDGVRDIKPEVKLSLSEKAWAELFEVGAWDSDIMADTLAWDDRDRFLRNFNFATLPSSSKTDRSITELLLDFDMWYYSTRERRKFNCHVEDLIRMREIVKIDKRYAGLVSSHEAKRLEVEADERTILKNALESVRIVGCTVNHASELQEVMNTICPKVFVVAEAGRTLEPNILAMLSPSIEHLIQIGNLQAPRHQNNCHDLSVGPEDGGTDYRLNMSMMERLAFLGFPTSVLKVSRKAETRTQVASRRREGAGSGDDETAEHGPEYGTTSELCGPEENVNCNVKQEVVHEESDTCESDLVLADLAAKAALIPPLRLTIYLREINDLIFDSLTDIVFPQIHRFPNRLKLEQFTSINTAGLSTAQPIQALAFNFEELFCFDSQIGAAWLRVTMPTFKQYAELAPLLSLAVETPLGLQYRIRSTLQSILCRIILALLARQFAAVSRFASDIQLAAHWSELAGAATSSRAAILGCRILLSQNIVLTVLNDYPDKVQTDRMIANDRLLARAETETGEIWKELQVAREAERDVKPGEHKVDGPFKSLERMQGAWRVIRACKKGGRAHEAAKGLKEGLERMADLLGMESRD